MTHHRTLITWLVDHEVAQFLEPLEWFSNGERGHLHASRNCGKLNRRSTPVVHRLTVADVRAGRKVCEDCFGGAGSGSEEHRRVRDRLEPLADVDLRIGLIDHLVMQTHGFGEIDKALRTEALAELRTAFNAVPVSAEFEQLHQLVGERLDDAAGRHRPDPEVLRQQFAVAGAVDLIEDIMGDRRNEPFWFDADVAQEPLLAKGLYDNPITEMFKPWRTNVADVGPQAAASLVLEQLRPSHAKWFRDVTQIDQLGVVAPLPGETLAETVKRAYSDCLDRILTKVMSSWVAKVDAFSADTAPVVLAVYDRWSSMGVASYRSRLDLLVLKSSMVASRADKHAAVLSGSLAQWVKDRGSDRRLTAEIVDHDAVSAEQLDTALALWDPGSRGAYDSFGDALAAARAL